MLSIKAASSRRMIKKRQGATRARRESEIQSLGGKQSTVGVGYTGIRTTVRNGYKVHPRTFIDGWGDLSELPFRVTDVVLRHLQCRAGLLALHRNFIFLEIFLCVEANLSLEWVSIVLIK